MAAAIRASMHEKTTTDATKTTIPVTTRTRPKTSPNSLTSTRRTQSGIII